MSSTPKQVNAGQAVYTRSTLAVYDFVVLGISNRLIWKCPTQRLEQHYERYLTANHLDVGVGTGYFLDRCRFPVADPRVALMDLNMTALEFTARRIGRYNPSAYRANVLQPISIDAAPFDSVGINYLLHCLPGTMSSKSILVDHLKTLMTPNAVMFGSTLLHGGVERSWAARRLMTFYNRKGIFTNEQDDLVGLQRVLDSRFRSVSIEVVGCAALFAATDAPGARHAG